MSLKILIIEDDPYVRRLYRRIFLFKKYQVEIAESGEEGLKKAETFNPAIILLDILMSEMGGMEVLKRLKSNKETRDIPVVILTAVDDDEHIHEATELGAVGYLLKSDYSPQQVAETIEFYIKNTKY